MEEIFSRRSAIESERGVWTNNFNIGNGIHAGGMDGRGNGICGRWNSKSIKQLRGLREMLHKGAGFHTNCEGLFTLWSIEKSKPFWQSRYNNFYFVKNDKLFVCGLLECSTSNMYIYGCICQVDKYTNVYQVSIHNNNKYIWRPLHCKMARSNI